MAPVNNTNHTFSFPQANLSLCDVHEQRLSRLEDSMVALASSYAQMSKDTEWIKACIERIDRKLDGMLESLDRAAGGLSAAEARIDGLEDTVRATKRTLWGAITAVALSVLGLAQSWVRKALGL